MCFFTFTSRLETYHFWKLYTLYADGLYNIRRLDNVIRLDIGYPYLYVDLRAVRVYDSVRIADCSKK